ncbi:hypothetical protein TH19_16770 [Thalassospira profundimaris]|uniref:PAS domain-containing protein n=1 Tax=Thalassospira profundimaris TaxID=502049 RepID=A0A367W246_9PROT|nr:hypothetical protein [Thalassospira profundimaris]RCK33857.1 hypothetical protein TH19_16770 [Thalassospira profundimaris]
MTASYLLDATDTELDRLPDNVDSSIITLVDLWYDAFAQAGSETIPSRTILRAERLRQWRDDICLYEYLPVKNDFLVRIDAPSIVALNGESFQGSTPREIDLKYGTCLMAALHKTLKTKRPTFHYVHLIGPHGNRRQWLRVLMPAQTVDHLGDPVFQVLGVRFEYEPMHYI